MKIFFVSFSDLREAILPIDEEHQRIIDARAGSGINPVEEVSWLFNMAAFIKKYL